MNHPAIFVKTMPLSLPITIGLTLNAAAFDNSGLHVRHSACSDDAGGHHIGVIHERPNLVRGNLDRATASCWQGRAC